MRFPLSTGMAKNGNFIPVIERNRAVIPGPKGNNGNKGGEYFPHMETSFWYGKGDIPNENIRLPPLEVHFGVGGCGRTDSAVGAGQE